MSLSGIPPSCHSNTKVLKFDGNNPYRCSDTGVPPPLRKHTENQENDGEMECSAITRRWSPPSCITSSISVHVFGKCGKAAATYLFKRGEAAATVQARRRSHHHRLSVPLGALLVRIVLRVRSRRL